MDIKEIDLLNLKCKLLNDDMLSTGEVSIINEIIWGVEGKPVEGCDVIVVLGNPTCVVSRLPTAIQLYYKYKPSYLVLSGGVCIPGEKFTEAEAMYNKCIENGIEKIHLIKENQSTTTKENVEFICPILKDELGIAEATVLVVSSPAHMRRIKMNFTRFQSLCPSGVKVILIPSSSQGYNKFNWTENEFARNEIATELGFIHEYLVSQEYSTFEVNVEVK